MGPQREGHNQRSACVPPHPLQDDVGLCQTTTLVEVIVTTESVSGLPVFSAGTQGAPLLLVAGPPASARVFAKVQERMLPRRTLAVELTGARIPDGTNALDALAGALERLGAEVGATTLFVHGAAVPVGLRTRAEQFKQLILCNGPVTRPGVELRLLRRIPSFARKGLLSGSLANRWLASSFALRRTVTNPYAMDRDMVVTLTEPWLKSAEGREMASRWLLEAGAGGPVPTGRAGEIVAIWGDRDVLYPLSEAAAAVDLAANGQVLTVAGGRHYFMVERPWRLAELLEQHAKSG